MHYYQFHIGDYQQDTAHLEPMEDLAYRRMLDLYYKTESPLPLEVEEVARLIRMRTHCECIALVLREFFERTEEGWFNQRVKDELDRTYAKSDAARRSAEARWAKQNRKKGKEKQTVNANAMRTQCETHANGMLPMTHDPIPNTHSKSMSPQAGDQQAVFDYWCYRMNKGSKTKFSAKRKRLVDARLKEGRSVEDIRQAIDGCASSPFHMGLGPKSDGTVYNDLELICRNNEKLEQFMQLYEKPPGQQVVINGQSDNEAFRGRVKEDPFL